MNKTSIQVFLQTLKSLHPPGCNRVSGSHPVSDKVHPGIAQILCDLPKPSGLWVSCDIPIKQIIVRFSFC